MIKKQIVPNRLQISFRDSEAEAEFDYDAGESQWFDAMAGVGSPGYPAFVELIDVFIGDSRIPAEELDDAEIASIERQLMDQIDAYLAEQEVPR